MGNIFNSDFRDFISALNKHQVKYMLKLSLLTVNG